MHTVGTADASRDADRGTRVSAQTIDLRALSRAVHVELPQLPQLRDAAIATWRGRMINEYSSAKVFEGLAAHAQRANLDSALVAEVEAFAAEERQHGVLCGAVVEALGGAALAPHKEEHAYPLHKDVSELEGLLRNLLSISCMSETVAVALIGAERLEMPDGPLRELLTGIWSDEVGHARFGWRLVQTLVPTLDAEAKARLTKYLAVAFEHLERHELAHLPLDSKPPAEGAELGLCDGGDARLLFFETIRDVIIPGFEAVGLDAARAWKERLRYRATAQ